MTKFMLNKSIKLLVCNMADTTINDSKLIFNTLYKTIRDYDIYIDEKEIKNWKQTDSISILKKYINSDIEYKYNDAIFPQMLNSYKTNLKNEYLKTPEIELIDPELPTLFNSIREQNIKIGLYTEYPVEIQRKIIDKLNMNDYIDAYISKDQILYNVNSTSYTTNSFRILMNTLNINNSCQVVTIGDSISDINESKNINSGCNIGVLTGNNNHKELIDSGADLVLNSVMDISIN
jgi:phosphoglycolate phosphatase-like HAD superfamily hydrolase